MARAYPLIHVDDVVPENMQQGEGWAISEFRLPISGKHGSATTVFHSIFRPGSTHAKHVHQRCDEIAVYLKAVRKGRIKEEDRQPTLRPELAVLFLWFEKLNRRRRYDMGSPLPIAYEDIEAFGRMMRLDITPLQVEMLTEIDDVYLLAQSKSAEAKAKRDAKAAAKDK